MSGHASEATAGADVSGKMKSMSSEGSVPLGRRAWRFLPCKRWARVTLLCGVLAFAALFGLEALAEAGGHSLDPMNYNTYALRNDLPAPAYVHLCADAGCARLDQHADWVEVKPGAADDEQVYWGSNQPTVYAVATSPSANGAPRCLALDAAHKLSSTVNAPLSSAATCRA